MAKPDGPSAANPLAVTYPSPQILFNYPLLATNVKLLCDKDSKLRAQSSLTTTIKSLRTTFHTEGIWGLYHGVHLYMLHQGIRDAFRFFTDRCIRQVEKSFPTRESVAQGEQKTSTGAGLYRVRMFAKYVIDAICYPVLLASTRSIVLRHDSRSTWEFLKLWRNEEGALSLFQGVTASLLSSAVDEAMELVLSGSIDRCSAGCNIETADKLLLKVSSSSVVSIFTSPINYVGVIQRCQSTLPGMLTPSPLWDTVYSLPWKSSLYQFVMFGGILALNVRLIQWKLELQAQDDNEDPD